MSFRLRGADWDRIANNLGQTGWSHLRAALEASTCAALLDAAPEDWHPLPPEEGVVRQAGFSTYAATADCEITVNDLACELVDALSEAETVRAWPQLPAFNETTWVHYPRGVGHITAHRDPTAYTGIIAVCNLEGEAKFRVFDVRGPTEWTTSAGDVVLFCGSDWPTTDRPRPRHEADPPLVGDRTIMTLRHNIRGAGHRYDV